MSLVLALILSAGAAAQADQDPLAALVEVLKISDDDAFRLDILKGIRDGLKGRTKVSMPKGWTEVAGKLGESKNSEVRSLATMISITFGDPNALLAHDEDSDDHNLPLMYWYAAEPVAGADIRAGASLAAKSKIPRVREYVSRRMAASVSK